MLGLGRLHNDKAFDTLIKAVAGIPDFHLWIAGEGLLRSELESLIEELGIGSRVKLLGWRNDRAALLQAADICAFVSRNEGFGTVFIQSWAQKTPLVVSDADGPRQFVKDDDDALMTKIDDIEGIKRALKRLNEDPKLAEKLVKNGFKRYQSDFTKAVCLQRYLDFYHHIREKEGL